jgi:heme/copper-type cytochrome/quinol oxidase subunit 2
MAVALGALLAIRRQQICHEGWQAPHHPMEAIVRNANQWLLWAVLTAVLVVAATYCVSVWQATPSMPLYRNIIFGGAIVLMLVFGCGLIALMFYSRRKGHDQPARSNRTQRK